MRFLGRMRRRWEEQEIFNKDMIALVNDLMKIENSLKYWESADKLMML